MVLFGRNIFILITDGKRKLAFLTAAIAIISILAKVVIFAWQDNKPLNGKAIIIDPGHGGIDGGTNDGHSFFEKDINLQISRKLKAELESKGASVDMTRDTDISLDKLNNLSKSRHRRDLLARVAYFNSGKYDIFISVHVNFSSNSRAKGPVALYSGKNQKSLLLAQCMQEELNLHAKNVLKKDKGYAPVESGFFILISSQIPGVIFETGFISNPEEKRLLKDETYQEKLVQAAARGIEAYFDRLENHARQCK